MTRKYLILLRYIGAQRRWFALIVALTLGASVLSAAQPWPLKFVIDNVLKKEPLPPALEACLARLGLQLGPTGLLLLATLGGLLIFALTSILDMGLTSAWTMAGQRMVFSLAEDLFARFQRRSLLFHSRNSVGDVMSRVTGDCWCVHHVVDTLLFAPAHAFISIAIMAFVMAQLDLKLTLLALAMAPLMLAASFVVGKPLQNVARLRREIESRIQAHIQQTLTGIPVVQAFAQEEKERERFEEFAEAAVRAQQRSTLLGGINNLGSGLVTTLGTGVVLWVAARHVLEGRLSLGSIFIFIGYLPLLESQMGVLAQTQTALRAVNASVERVMEGLLAPSEVSEKPNAVVLQKARGHVRLEEVVFGYETGRPVLRGISLEAKPGQIVAIVGETGAGKSTLVNLVPRFFDPWQGRVILDGNDVRDLQLRSLRQQVGLVLQEPYLFPCSIAENIAYGRPGASQAELEAAARDANALEFIQRLPKGFNTLVGERGATLSGGERQRLSIARALLKNAPILILDEPTSALDAATEHLLLEALERLMTGRTTFIIAHRLSTVRRAERILVFKDGQIAEQGTHAELLAVGHLYAHLHELQFGTVTPAVPSPAL